MGFTESEELYRLRVARPGRKKYRSDVKVHLRYPIYTRSASSNIEMRGSHVGIPMKGLW